MTNRSYRRLAEGLAQLGALTPAQADAALAEISRWASDLDEERGVRDLVSLFSALPMAVLVPDKVDDLEEAYQAILNEAAACSGGSVVIDDIEFVEDEDGSQSLGHRSGTLASPLPAR
ncbi:hypothetical protein ABGB18_06490 [Nonomuraea sp. B12E4]|uniref:hypothetical protein n=1 Tax=Nonomuraea sp. B12E4 TaxID=3153564 RepID=UPI00325DE289